MEKKQFQYELLADEQVVELSAQGDKAATEYILSKYKNLVRARAKIYFLAGADREDLVQEGMIGLFKAVRDFDPTKQASFRGFAEMCIKRQLITAVKTAARQKHMPLNSYVSLSSPVYEDESERTLVDMLAEREAVDPEEMFLRREKAEALEAEIAQKLSALEQTVLSLHLGGMNYQEIAVELGRSPKSIDNALQRIKRKLSASEPNPPKDKA
ncbi:RNA polymerase sporulation sigma factor SigH [Ructibacterium gallinarum]|uniref:RNA polymerase sporulation sigma factor SigH n=1 Tax=Ructibacterium gallinarum TaxID=2779355 RepID=A0A9D5R892_9FIRM|nr:RNA polymerase sporulation sigma factor SigH [Ructibacterium gallinarum]MBE5039730.1 RNA polymerase sporulation sigma factor SigH [Ructibacterium gallinarum]